MVGLGLTGDQVRIDEGLGDEMIRGQYDVASRFGFPVDFEVYGLFLMQHKLSMVKTGRQG